MQNFREWERMRKLKNFKEFGVQRWWKKVEYILEELF